MNISWYPAWKINSAFLASSAFNISCNRVIIKVTTSSRDIYLTMIGWLRLLSSLVMYLSSSIINFIWCSKVDLVINRLLYLVLKWSFSSIRLILAPLDLVFRYASNDTNLAKFGVVYILHVLDDDRLASRLHIFSVFCPICLILSPPVLYFPMES